MLIAAIAAERGGMVWPWTGTSLDSDMLVVMRIWLRGPLLALILSTPVLAQVPTPDPSKFGASLDVGVPDGAVLSGVFRPTDWVRIELGVGYNAISPGLRVGATFTPFHFLVTPSLTLEAGHYFTGDSGSKLQALVGSNGTAAQDFRNVSYDYGNLQLGLELGGGRFAGFLHLGVSYVQGTIHDFQTVLQKDVNDPTLEAGDPTLRFTSPSLKLGMIFYFG